MTVSYDKAKKIFESMSPQLGTVLKVLYDSGNQNSPGQLNIAELFSCAPGLGQAEIWGALSILYSFGIVIDDEHGNVIVTSKYARFALGSLSEFLMSSMPIVRQVNTDEHDRKFITTITEAMETARKDEFGLNKPLHSRDIVNVIIKGKQIRNWREQDVYLHVYHKKWQAYHLIGLGRKVMTRSIDEVAQRAMEIKLMLKPYQYELDKSISPEPVEYIDISGSHGAITQYTIFAKVAKSFEVDLNSHLRNLINNPSNDVSEMTFRWFTANEIDHGLSDNGEAIMQSTSRVLRSVDPKYVLNVVGKVGYLRKRPSMLAEISNGINLRKAIFYAVATLSSLSLVFFSRTVLIYLNTPSYLLDNLSNLMEVIGGVLTICFLVKGWLSSS
jgi:hypothetical protein